MATINDRAGGGAHVQSIVCCSKTIVDEMSVYLWFNEDDVDKKDNKVVLNVLVREFLTFVLRVLEIDDWILWLGYALS